MTCAKVCTNPGRSFEMIVRTISTGIPNSYCNWLISTSIPQSLHGFGHVQHRPDGASIVAKSGMPTLQRRRSPSNIARKADFRAVIDGIAAAANEMIDALLKRSSGTVDLT